MGTRCDFADDHASAQPCDHVTAVGDVNLRFVITALNLSAFVDRIQLGMKRPAEDVER